MEQCTRSSLDAVVASWFYAESTSKREEDAVRKAGCSMKMSLATIGCFRQNAHGTFALTNDPTGERSGAPASRPSDPHSRGTVLSLEVTHHQQPCSSHGLVCV